MDSKMTTKGFIYSLPNQYRLLVYGNNLAFNFEPNNKEELIKSLVKEFQKWD